MEETNLRAKTLRLLRSAGGAWLALALLLAVCALTSAPFRNPQNLLNIVRQSSYGGIVALGMTFVIVSGGIDLSVGSLFALSGVCALLAGAALPASWPPALSFAVACAAGLAAGLAGGALNGALVAAGGLPPFIATLGTYSIFRSLALYLADSGTVPATNPLFGRIGGGAPLGIPAPVLALLALAVLLDVALALTPFGRHALATGASERVRASPASAWGACASSATSSPAASARSRRCSSRGGSSRSPPPTPGCSTSSTPSPP